MYKNLQSKYKEEYKNANTWTEKAEIIEKMKDENMWEALEELVPPEKLSDFYLEEHDGKYYRSKNPDKLAQEDNPYLTHNQEIVRSRREICFSDLSYNQLKKIQKKNVDIDIYLDDMF